MPKNYILIVDLPVLYKYFFHKKTGTEPQFLVIYGFGIRSFGIHGILVERDLRE